MKKLIVFIALCVLCSKMLHLQAQTPLTQNFVIKDLNGNNWDFYDLLNKGYTIVFDASATWCGPCWNYHKSHKLRDLYDHYGPKGTIQPNKVMVFLIEVDCGTSASELDPWKSGTTYPIVSLDNPICSKFNKEFKIGGFPVVFMICGDKKWYTLGQPSEQDVLNQIAKKCKITSGIDNDTNNEKFVIYPNPANSSVNIQVQSDSYKMHYSIHNLMGEQISTGTIPSKGKYLEAEISVTGMTAGVYLLRINDDNNSWIQRLVIQ